MPNLRCPSCYYSTSFRKDNITENIQCSNCKFNLHAYYYAGRDEKVSKDFIESENQRLKKIKATQDRSKNIEKSESNENNAVYSAVYTAEKARIDAEYDAKIARLDIKSDETKTDNKNDDDDEKPYTFMDKLGIYLGFPCAIYMVFYWFVDDSSKAKIYEGVLFVASDVFAALSELQSTLSNLIEHILTNF